MTYYLIAWRTEEEDRFFYVYGDDAHDMFIEQLEADEDVLMWAAGRIEQWSEDPVLEDEDRDAEVRKYRAALELIRSVAQVSEGTGWYAAVVDGVL